MKYAKYFKTLLTASICATTLAGCTTPGTHLSTYRYNVFNNTGVRFGEGRLELSESPKGAKVRIVLATSEMSQCVASSLKASVTRDEIYTTIVTEPAFGNCDTVKFQIRNDGKGGTRYALVGGEWVKDQYDRGLTPKD